MRRAGGKFCIYTHLNRYWFFFYCKQNILLYDFAEITITYVNVEKKKKIYFFRSVFFCLKKLYYIYIWETNPHSKSFIYSVCKPSTPAYCPYLIRTIFYFVIQKDILSKKMFTYTNRVRLNTVLN